MSAYPCRGPRLTWTLARLVWRHPVHTQAHAGRGKPLCPLPPAPDSFRPCVPQLFWSAILSPYHYFVLLQHSLRLHVTCNGLQGLWAHN